MKNGISKIKLVGEGMRKINLNLFVSEYQNYVAQSIDKNDKIKWDKLISLLCKDGDWTMEGAETLVHLVQNYGSFILKNALALAEAANIEDGKLGL
jgi:hypothetical protein